MLGNSRNIRVAIIAKAVSLLLAGLLSAAPTWAALPDPVAFSWAVERGDIAKVRSWLDEGLDPEFQGSQVGSGRCYGRLARQCRLDATVCRAWRQPAPCEPQRRTGAATGGVEQPYADAVKWLLAHGATVNRDGNYWGALHYATFNGHKTWRAT